MTQRFLDNIVSGASLPEEGYSRLYPLKQALPICLCLLIVWDMVMLRAVYRHPGVGTEKSLVDRAAEEAGLRDLLRIGLDSTLFTRTKKRVEDFQVCENAQNLDPHNLSSSSAQWR